MAFTGGFYVKAVDRNEALKLTKKKFKRGYNFDNGYPRFSIKKER
jgi:hypothetical protein